VTCIWNAILTLDSPSGLYRYTAEVTSTNSLVDVLRRTIEAEQKVLHELVLQGDAFHIDKHVYMYEPPTAGPDVAGVPVEEPQHDQFTVAQLVELAGELRAVYPDNLAPHGDMTSLLHGLSAVATGTSLLPAAWLGLPLDTVAQLMASLEHGPTVDWRQLIIAAMRLPTATAEDILALVAERGTADRAQFLAQPMWFDVDVPGGFSRSAACKEFLFDLLSTGGPAERVVDLKAVALWLCRCVDDVNLALRTALAVGTGRAADAGPVPGDAALQLEDALAVLNYDQAQTDDDSGSSYDVDPVNEVALTALWAESGNSCCVDELLSSAEIAHCIEAKFARVDLRGFSNVVAPPSE
jgi:hypothetical protein